MAEFYAGVYCGLDGVAVAVVPGAAGSPDISAYMAYGPRPAYVGWRIGRALVVAGWCWEQLQRTGRPALVALIEYPEPSVLSAAAGALQALEVGAVVRAALAQNKVPMLEVPVGNAVGRDPGRGGEKLARSRALTLARTARGGPLRCEDPRITYAR